MVALAWRLAVCFEFRVRVRSAKISLKMQPKFPPNSVSKDLIIGGLIHVESVHVEGALGWAATVRRITVDLFRVVLV